MFNSYAKIKTCRKSIVDWHMNHTTNSKVRINQLQSQLEETKANLKFWNSSLVRSLEQQLSCEIQNEEKFWEQKARTSWLKSGDQNTSFFHAKVIQSRKRNFICGFLDKNGVWKINQNEVQSIAASYFHEIYSSLSPSDFTVVTAGLAPKVIDTMNVSLIAPISFEKVKRAVFKIHPTKAPGEDGLRALFHHKF